MFDKPFTFDRVVRIGIGVLLIGALLYLIVVLRNALLPFLIAAFCEVFPIQIETEKPDLVYSGCSHIYLSDYRLGYGDGCTFYFGRE